MGFALSSTNIGIGTGNFGLLGGSECSLGGSGLYGGGFGGLGSLGGFGGFGGFGGGSFTSSSTTIGLF